MAIYSIYFQFKKHTGSETYKHLSEQNCKQKSKLVSCHFTLNLCHITQSKKCTNSSLGRNSFPVEKHSFMGSFQYICPFKYPSLDSLDTVTQKSTSQDLCLTKFIDIF